MTRITAALEWILRLPLIWGSVACLAFYALLISHTINSPLLERYTNRHPVEIVEVTVFFVGLAALVMRMMGLAVQFGALSRLTLEPIPVERQSVADCGRLLAQLQHLPARLRETYLVRRLWDAIAYVRRTGSADALERHLRHLEEVEAGQIHSSYSIVRIIVWAIPILGLLGTVIGITIAVANLDPTQLEESTSKVTAGLGVAFDHTATALTLTMILMFIKAGVERIEDRLLALVDARVAAELVGRFEETGTRQDPNVAVIRAMSEEVLTAVEQVASRQADIWKDAIAQSNAQWGKVSVAASEVVKDSLASSLKEALTTTIAENLEQHARTLSTSASDLANTLQRQHF